MNTNAKRNISRAMVFSFALLVSAASSAWHAGGGAGWGGYHGGEDYSSNYYHNGGYYRGGGGFYGDGWGGPGVVIASPGYYPSPCQTVQVCAPTGNCWLQQSCD